MVYPATRAFFCHAGGAKIENHFGIRLFFELSADLFQRVGETGRSRNEQFFSVKRDGGR